MHDAAKSEPQTATGRRPAFSDTETIPRASPRSTDAAVAGRYVVLKEVGRGGMGRVLRAYDPKLQREVAIKELWTGALDEVEQCSAGQVDRERIVAEARAMAKLSHPNVVAVYDVERVAEADRGPAEGEHLFLVMEYVRGSTLKDWLRGASQSWREVVDCFIQAGRGLAAAHAAGLLHRDFKPANVMLADRRFDGRRVAKVTDFGLAKVTVTTEASVFGATASVSHSSSASTQPGVVLGTRRYMAPEQHRGEPLTAAADQYALCVSLWEALCRKAPFSGKALVAAKCNGPPAWPNNSVPTTIVQAIRRGLAARPSDRWPDMDGLLDALGYDPLRRRRWWLAGGAGLATLGLAGAVGHSWVGPQWEPCSGAASQLLSVWHDSRQRDIEAAMVGTGVSYAAAAWERTRRSLDRYAADWAAMYTEACEATAVRGAQSIAVMDVRMACLHQAKMELEAATTVLADADEDVLRNAETVVAGLHPLDRCADVEALQAEVEPPSSAEAQTVERVRALLAEAKVEREAGRYRAARTQVEAAKVQLEGVRYLPIHARAALEHGFVLERLAEYEASEAALREAWAFGAKCEQRDVMRDAASSLLTVVGDRLKKMEVGLRYRELAQGLAVGDPVASAVVAQNVGLIFDAQGKYAEAEAEYRRALALKEGALGPAHPDTLATLGNLATALAGKGQYAEAEKKLRRALALRVQAYGPRHPSVALTRNNLARTLDEQGKYAQSEAEHRQALAVWEQALGSDHPDVAASRNNLGMWLLGQGRVAEAEEQFRAALELFEKFLGPDHPHVGSMHNNLAAVLHAQNKHEDSIAELRRTLAVYRKALGPGHPEVNRTRGNLVVALDSLGRDEEAEAEYRGVLAAQLEALGEQHPDVAGTRHNLAGLLLDRGDADQALPFARQAWTRRGRGDIPPAQRAETAFVLAKALWATQTDREQRAQARALAKQALSDYSRGDGELSSKEDQVRRWLDARRGR